MEPLKMTPQEKSILLRVPLLRSFFFSFYPPKYLAYAAFIPYCLIWFPVSLGSTFILFNLPHQTIEFIYKIVNQQRLESIILTLIPSAQFSFNIAKSSPFDWQQLLLVYTAQLVLLGISLLGLFILTAYYRKNFYPTDSKLFQQAAQNAQKKTSATKASSGLIFFALFFVLMGSALILTAFLRPVPYKAAYDMAAYVQHVGFSFSKECMPSLLPFMVAVFFKLSHRAYNPSP